MKKITIFGSCRQDSLYNSNYDITSIQNEISYPHYTKEILEIIKFIKYNHITPFETMKTFRTPIITQTPIYSSKYKTELENTDIFIIEIASKLAYELENRYVHHVMHDNQNITGYNNVNKKTQTDEEIETDILKIKEELNTNNIIIVGHIVTYEKGERYKLSNLLQTICTKHNILFIDPVKEITKKGHDIYDLIKNEYIISHYNEKGHVVIKEIYDDFIKKFSCNMDYLRVYESDKIKTRISAIHHINNIDDGGYVIADGLEYDLLISCGIGDNCNFENAFLEKYNTCKCYAFDGTIDNLPYNSNSKINFITPFFISNADFYKL